MTEINVPIFVRKALCSKRPSLTKLCWIALASLLSSQVWANQPALVQDTSEEEKLLASKQQALEVIQIFGNQQALYKATGSANLIDKDTLEQFEYDDIHRVLQTTPGVYIREEDGYGLRPNIGLRGATSERSSKIAIMEDGILIAPAPYSAPAAYFFPLISRMQKVEIFKGPSAIRFGPNTVGGAMNMVSTSIGAPGSGEIDVAAGQQGYRKFYGNYSQAVAGFDLLVEGVHLAADGFKDLPNGDDTGFAKNEWLAKAAYDFNNGGMYQRFLAKVSYSDEVSDETYLGLSDDDFAQSPYQRYAASGEDKLDWEHLHFSLSHYIEIDDDTTIFTKAYRRDFNRDWDRLNRFESNRTIASILQAPNTGLNSLFMAILRGERDSLLNDDTLLQTLNDRTYYSQGVQTKLLKDVSFDDVDLALEIGFRAHQDQVERLHRDRFYVMRSGALARATRTDEVTISNKDQVSALAGYVNSNWTWANLTASAGIRVERISADAKDNLMATDISTSDTIVMPGAGVFYEFTANIGVVAGINKGFVPNSPGQLDSVEPEQSWNYEFGVRANAQGWRTEAIGFFNDYSNLKGSCTFSSGCQAALDSEFNGGEVDVYGLEFLINKSFVVNKTVSLPFTLAYTHTQSEFKTAFTSSFSQWGSIQAGDELPYLPENQVGINIGLVSQNLQLALQYKYIAKMLEAAGKSTELEGEVTDSISQFDLSAWYQVANNARVYAKLDNLTDEINIVSRRPFGARPNKPRQFMIGVKYTFN
jgi:Fe(3+) dicitrate transport protein